MAKILLVDADSKIPNIPLMKLSSYHKNNMDDVELIKLNMPYYPNRMKKEFKAPKGYDKIYCSVIFEGNKQFIKGDNIIFGGTGYNLKTNLPEYIENLDCDYTLYPDNDVSYGFLTRGCIRKCQFCKVPEKEGYIHRAFSVNQIVRHKKVKFLDNNILAWPKHYEILQELIDKNIKCQFNQGLDIRLVNYENSELLKRINYLGEYYFAFDNIKYQKIIDEKLYIMNWRKPWSFKFFIYVSPIMPLLDTIFRLEFLRNRQCLPYVMRDISCWADKNSEFYTDLASWANQPNLFKKMTFEEFLGKRHVKRKRIEYSLKLWNDNQGGKKDGKTTGENNS